MTADAPLVSIVTPVYNGAQYLDELIRSVCSQDCPGIEHIVIDDGSTDGGATTAVLKRYPHLRWWSRENRGQYATMNEGLDSAGGEWVCFVSADDVVEPSAVRRAVEFFRRHPECDGGIGYTRAMTETGEPYAAPPFQWVPVRFYAYFHQISHCSLYLRCESLRRRRLTFNPALKYVGDYDWLIRIVDALAIGRIRYPLATVRIHRRQASRVHREAMTAEQRRVVSAYRINPLMFFVFRNAYILLHDAKKFHSAVKNGGMAGAKQLLMNHFLAEPSARKK
jgi:glycosyltransferase involved in cell wall biosynthesis